jgi:hypothetical protein
MIKHELLSVPARAANAANRSRRLDYAAVLRWRACNRALRFDGATQLIERRQRVHRPVPQTRRDQRLPIHALGVGAHRQQRRRLAAPTPHPMQTNELLQSVHIHALHAPSFGRSAARSR